MKICLYNGCTNLAGSCAYCREHCACSKDSLAEIERSQGVIVFLVVASSEVPHYEKLYPDLFDTAMVITVEEPQKCEGLRVKRLFVSEYVSRDEYSLYILTNSMLKTKGADRCPIFLDAGRLMAKVEKEN